MNITKQELINLLQKLYFNEEISKLEFDKIILNISNELELRTLQAIVRRKYQCFDMEAGAYMSELIKSNKGVIMDEI